MFPLKSSGSTPSGPVGKGFGRKGPATAACSEIIGGIPIEWARCLLPLVRDKKVKVEGRCKSASDVLGADIFMSFSLSLISVSNLHFGSCVAIPGKVLHDTLMKLLEIAELLEIYLSPNVGLRFLTGSLENTRGAWVWHLTALFFYLDLLFNS
ncbi:hypothetical protein DITRI_Ditri15bG0095900 [Diplodiscus trichospermus]